jgi:hypothetical protein
MYFAALWLCGCLPGDGESEIRIDSPVAGERVSGEVPIRVSYTEPLGYRGWSMAFDAESLGAHLERYTPLMTRTMYTWDWPNGNRTLYVEMYGWGYRSWRDSVEFVVDNPPQRLIRERHSPSARPGDRYTIDLEFNLPDLKVQPHEFALPGVELSDILIRQISPTGFKLEFTLPSERLRSQYPLKLLVTNGEREAVMSTSVSIARSRRPR